MGHNQNEEELGRNWYSKDRLEGQDKQGCRITAVVAVNAARCTQLLW